MVTGRPRCGGEVGGARWHDLEKCTSRETGSVRKRNRVFTPAFKAAAVERMRRGEHPAALARELNIKRRLLYEWRRAVAEGRPLRAVGRPKLCQGVLAGAPGGA